MTGHEPDTDLPDQDALDHPRRGGRPWLPAVAAAIAAAVVAGVTGLSIAAPDRPADRSAEAGFGRDMAVHHAQAVDMAVTVRDNTRDREVRTLALDIALTQQNQIGRMQAWLIEWRLPPTGDRPAMAWMSDAPGHRPGHSAGGSGTPMPGMATPAALQRLRAARDRNAEVLFLTLMIRHHRGGVEMAEAAVARTDRPEVRSLARSIVGGQRAEIGAMQKMLRDRGAPQA